MVMQYQTQHPSVQVQEDDNPEQVYMALLMGELRKDKVKDMDIQFIKTWFPLTDLKSPTVLGSFAWTCRSLKKKWIMRPYAYHTGWAWCTPADIARDYLTIKYPDRRRITSQQYRTCVSLKRTPPLMAIPQTLDDAVYLDLKSAYWSILRVVGWDVDYSPDRFMEVRSDVEDFPYPELKLARNSLVSSGVGGEIRIWTGEKLVFRKKYNQFQNDILWALVQDVLNSVAREILPFAVYINTDGYIVKREFLNDVMDIIHEWGLPCSVKYAGRCSVYNLGQYNIEGKNWVEPKGSCSKAVVKVHHPNIQWLKREFSAFARDRKLI